jgi:pimeloyl-ACP methyl ester carboxylesterase
MPFRESHVNADGSRIRYMEAGNGPPLIHLHGAQGLQLTPAHDLLSQHHRVIVFEMPDSLENNATIKPLASTMAKAAQALDIKHFDLMGSSFGGTVALWLAVQHPEHVRSLVLEAPAAIHDTQGSLEEYMRQLPTPTLVLFGTLDRVAMGRHYKALLPNSHLVFVYNAGHRIAAERPEAFTEVVADFLERREAFVVSRRTTLIHP